MTCDRLFSFRHRRHSNFVGGSLRKDLAGIPQRSKFHFSGPLVLRSSLDCYRREQMLSNREVSEIPLDRGLSGRTERRLPIIVVVCLAHCQPAGTDGEEERTYTDNISPHGARVFSKNLWQLGDAVRVTPLHGDSACGKVVHCQRLPDDRYSIGVNFQGCSVKWSALQRYGSLIE